jgi:hypothetical protein
MRWIVLPALAALDPPMRWIQRKIGLARLPYVFLLPTMLIFGMFSFLPAVLNIWISFTGGSSTLVSARPFVGLQNYEALLACESIFVPKSCPVSGFAFWTGMWNTLAFAVIQVPVMIVVALATAIVLNRKIRARGFWRAMFFYPVMLSPVVVAIVWDWVLKRRGILNALLADLTANYNALVASLPFDIAVAPFRAHHAAAADAHAAGRPRAVADPRLPGLRRGLRADGRRAGNGHAHGHPAYLRDRVRQRRQALRHRRGVLGAARRHHPRAHARAAGAVAPAGGGLKWAAP